MSNRFTVNFGDFRWSLGRHRYRARSTRYPQVRFCSARKAVQGTQEAVVGTRARRRAERALGYEEAAAAGRGSGKSRNGYSSKTVIGDDGAIEIVVPRDRNSTVESQIVPKGQTRPIASSASMREVCRFVRSKAIGWSFMWSRFGPLWSAGLPTRYSGRSAPRRPGRSTPTTGAFLRHP